jgi:DNA-binding beta-propeller fold protein YncE
MVRKTPFQPSPLRPPRVGFPFMGYCPLLLLLVCVAAMLCIGCSAVRPSSVVWEDNQVERLWPEPPEQPRIQLLRILTGPEDFLAQSGGKRFFRWLTGEKEQGLPLLSPYGVTADGQGRVWIADSGSRAVHFFDLARQRVDYFTMAGREPFLSPVDVAFDAGSSRLYVSDSMLKQVFVLDPQGRLLGSVQPADGFLRPGGVAVDDAGALYVVDVLRGVVDVFSRQGLHLRRLVSALAEDGFNRPSNVAVDGVGRVYVVDSMNFRVEILAADGAGLGKIGQLGDVQGSFARPRGVAIDSKGHIYIADAAFDNIQVFDAQGQLLLVFGGPGRGQGQMVLPAGLFFDAADRLYLVDSFNSRVQIFQYLHR